MADIPRVTPEEKAEAAYYAEWEQVKHYRRAAWEDGCICPELTPPHVHWPRCPLFEREEDHAEARHSEAG